jgi:type VI secretion system protein ImpL
VLNFLTDNVAIVALLALSILFLLLLAVVVFAAVQGAAREDKDKAAQRAPARQMNIDSLKQSFRRAVELIESNLAARSERYNLGWTLVLNDGDSDRELPLVASGIPSALSTDATLATQALGIGWNFFDKGVAVQLQCSYLGDPDGAGSAGQKVWDEFLGLCRNYRPDRPFDSIVVSLPASAFLTADPQAQLDLVARAKAIHRRLWLVQNRFALQFPIYLVVSDCHLLPGFATFARALPESLRRGMLGWSSSHELSAPFSPQWIDTGMDDVTRDVQDACTELGALEVAGNDSASYFLLPAELERVRAGLKIFTEELMRPSAYHEPFIFRGFYLTGDCGLTSQLLAAAPAAAAADPGAGVDMVPAGDPAAVPLPPEITGSPAPAADLEPAFLRDLFEKKVFAEAGLVRASRVQRLSRPVLGRAVRWGAIAVPAVWAIGLVVAGVRLSSDSDEMVAALRQLDRQSRASLAGSGMVDLERNRSRAVSTLALMERVDAGAMWSLAVPGSWSLFDDLHERLRNRLERGFSENSLDPLRQGAYARVSALTGVPTDPSTGQLIAGAACTLPAGWDDQVRAAQRTGIDVEDVPEFQAMLQFMARLEELDRATKALTRLTNGTDAPSGDDLKVAARVFLGVELPGTPQRAAALLRLQSRQAAPVSLPAMQQAAACSFDLATQALYTRLFSRNELLLAERAITDRLQQVTANAAAVDWVQQAQGWQGVQDALRQQELLLGPGKGGWIRRRNLQLGQAHEQLLQRAQAASLLGAAPVDKARKLATDELARFLTDWDAAQAGKGDVLGGPGLQWQDKEGRWVMSEDRAALQASLTALRAQPFMRAASARSLPELPANSMLTWEKGKLEQALALADARKRFQSELLPKFPLAVREYVQGLADAALADAVIDQLAAGAVMVPRAAPGSTSMTGSEADRTRLAKVRMLLNEMGADDASTRLQQLLAADAVARLKVLDEAVRQAGLYQPRDGDLRAWGGDKGPMLAAFGVADVAGLQAYLAQQTAFLEGVGREAEPLLQALDGQANGDPVVQRWRAIVADLARYRLKSPASSLVALEQFVAVSSAEVDATNCVDKLPARATVRASDLFAERLASLQTAAITRCRELRNAEGQEAWARFAESFNRQLAGRSPFRTAGSADRPAADVEELMTVIKGFERVQKTAASATPPVRIFKDQMEKVRAFLAPLAPADEAAATGYDVAVEFRANAAAEIEGNKIIDWVMTVGNQTLRRSEAPRPLRWVPGQPVSVTLRLAGNAPVLPRPDAAQPDLVVEDRTVTYRAADPWSLFSLISQHREPEGSGRDDARAQLLRFEFPLATAREGIKAPPEESRARVYLKLTLSPAGKRTPLAWPGVFPARAPEWSAR